MNKRRWNRCVGLLMITFIAMTILAVTGVTAVAETLTHINLTIPEELLLAGATYKETVYAQSGNVTVEGNACTVESIRWTDGGGAVLTEASRLSRDVTYIAKMVLKPKAGDQFDPAVTVSLNGNYDVDYTDKKSLELSPNCELTPIVYGEITAVSLTGVPAAAPGNTAIPYSYIHTEGGKDQYTVTGTWYAYNASAQAYEPMAYSDHFTENGSYQLALHLDTKPGYIFDNPYMMVNDQNIFPDYLDDFECTFNLYTSSGTEIAEVFFDIPEPVEGQTFSNAVPITAMVPSGSPYTVQGNWKDENGNRTGTFTKGEDYFFECQIYANEGYYFAKDIEVTTNDTGIEWGVGRGKMGSHSYRSSLKIPIHEAILSNVPKAEVGKTIPIGEFQLDVPAGAKYHAKAIWLDESKNPIADETVKAGKRYILEINLTAHPMYQFAESYSLKINGIVHRRLGNTDGDKYEMEYSFLNQIYSIEVTGVVEPVVGEAPVTASLQPADPAKYTIVDAVWYDREDRMPATIFQTGHSYELEVEVEAKPGYEFAPYFSWKMGREEGSIGPFAAPALWLTNVYSFETIIPEIRVSNIPSMKVGESARMDVSVPAGANYAAEAEWLVWNEKTEAFSPFSGTFEQGKTYRLSIHVLGNTGYRFAKGLTACYLDGVLQKDADIYEDLVSLEIDFAEHGAKVIHKVELNIRKPLTGEHSSVDPLITVPAGANYRQRHNVFEPWLVGDVQEQWPFQGYFAEGGSYGVNFMLTANEGYVFAKDLLIVVNGTVLPAEAYTVDSSKETYVNYFFGMTCQHVYENGQCLGCKEADPTLSLPKTGDSSRMALWFALLFISGGAIIALTVADRKRRT